MKKHIRNACRLNKLHILILLLFANQVFAQNDTIYLSSRPNVKEQKLVKQTSSAYCIVPSALITYGIITRFSSSLQKFDHKIDEKVQQNIHRQYKFDNYIQYAPYVGIYGLDLCGVKAKHNSLDRTLVLGTSIIFTASIVQGTKHFTQVERPDGSSKRSFPSGHTATAFLGAHVLFREYKDASPWIGAAGYGFAAATASMRVINRKHWCSDVVTGAGVGILCAELGYFMLPVWHKVFKIEPKNKGIIISPIITENNFGIGGIVIL